MEAETGISNPPPLQDMEDDGEYELIIDDPEAEQLPVDEADTPDDDDDPPEDDPNAVMEGSP